MDCPADDWLQPYRGTWGDDDPHATFKHDVAVRSVADPRPMFDNLSAETGIPSGSLMRYALVAWGSEGTEAILHAGPRVIRRLQAVCDDAVADGSTDARLAAFDTLRQMIAWLAIPIEQPTALDPQVLSVARSLVDLLRETVRPPDRPLMVALDGRSGTGKTTIAAAVATAMGSDEDGRPLVAVVAGDDFYTGGSAKTWDARSPEQNAAACIDWHRQRDVLESLRRTGQATYRAFDWTAQDWDADNPPLTAARTVHAAPIVLLEGVYSTRPELADLLDVCVRVDAAADDSAVRVERRDGTDDRAAWNARWSAAEEAYFATQTRRPDLIITT